MNLKSLFLADYNWIIYSYVLDIVVIFLAIFVFIWYYIYDTKKEKKKKNFKAPPLASNIKKIDDNTYLIEKEKTLDEYYAKELEKEKEQEQEETNAVEHFSKQITDIATENNAPTSDDSSNFDDEKPVEETATTPVNMENNSSKIGNFVQFNSTSKNNKPTSVYNHGSNAYGEATNFFSTIRQENEDIYSAKPQEKKKSNAKSKTSPSKTSKTPAAKKTNTTTKTAKKTSKTSK